MEIRTKKRLEKRWLSLPLHHIDTSVIVEAFFEDSKFYHECKGYLNSIGYKFRGSLSLSVVGELFLVIERDIKEEFLRELFFEFFDKLIQIRKVSITSPRVDSYKTAIKLKEWDYLIEDVDSLHVATAATSRAQFFATLDEKLVSNKRIESSVGLKMIRPF